MSEYCPNCGEEITQGSAFCSHCGEAITPQQSAAGGTRGTDHATGQQEAGWGESHQQQQTDRGPQVPRKGAVDTLSQAFGWATNEPALVGLFLLGGLVSGLLQVAAPALSFLDIIINSIVGAVAFIAAERKLQNSRFDVMAAVERAVDRVLPLVLVAIGYGLAVTVGLILLVIPGIYLGVRLSLALPACILDGRGVEESFSTSWDVAGKNMEKLFGIFLIYFGVFFAFAVVSFAAGGQGVGQNPAYLVGSSVIAALVGSVYSLAIGRIYLENRPGQPRQQFESQSQQY